MNKYLFRMVLLFAVSIKVEAQQQNVNTDYNEAARRSSFYIKMRAVNFNDSTKTRDDYLKKSKNQKTAAWIMLGGGVLMGTIGAIMFSQEFDIMEEKTSTGDAGGALFLLGVGCSLGSIPFFISSAYFARRAATFSFKNQELFLPYKSSFL